MSFKAINPQGAYAAMGADGAATYIDVRTVAEFAAGRPKGRAINVPIEFYHPKSGATHPNEAFQLVISHALAADTPVIVGAAEDERAAAAAAQIEALGFAALEVMVGGFPGWQASGLPVTGDNRDGVSYASLLTAARRAR